MSEREGEVTDYVAIYEAESYPQVTAHRGAVAAVVAAAKSEALEEAAVIAEGARLTLDDIGYEKEAIADSIRAAKEATQ